METTTKFNEINTLELETIFNAAYRKREFVNQFGQQIKNPNINNFEDETLIDSLEILKYLSNDCYDCYDLTGFGMYSNEVYELMELNFGEVEETSHVNTYNWSAPVTNDFDFKTFNSDSLTIIIVNVQNGYSDVRSGYGLQFMFVFDRVEDWFYLFEDIAYNSFNIDCLSFDFSLFSESGVFNVYDFESSEDIEYDVYIGDYSDCKTYAEDYLKSKNQ
jgi:hypothetical protein